MPKRSESYICEKCNFLCSKKCNWDKHKMTAKHNFRTLEQSVRNNADEKTLHKCIGCSKEYKSRSALWYHRKNADKCRTSNPANVIIESNNNDTNGIVPCQQIIVAPTNNDLVIELLKQNNELQKQIIEMAKEPKIVNYNNNQCTNNNQFNLNMFLNDTCKDALNIDDFMDSIKLTVEDLEQTGKLGFVQGITRIFLKGLRDLDITQRPFHCTDMKRETVYVKDKDKWVKETAEKTKMKQALNQAIRKNLSLIPLWREEHPNYLKSNTQDNDDYVKISLNSLGSEYDDEQQRMDEKIIRNVLREVILDRKNGINDV